MKKIILFTFLAIQSSFGQNPFNVGRFQISNDNIYNTLLNSGDVAKINMGFDGTKGYISFGAHTGNGHRHDILYMRGSDGNVGIGTSLPSALFDVYTPVLNKTTYNTQKWSTGNDGYELTLQTIWNNSGINQRFVQRYNGIDYNSLVFFAGNVGIGIQNPQNKLDVNGTIHSKEVKVDMTGWSDFVFKKEYNLPTLEEVEKHIVEKGHLENIPSEEEVLKNGINLGEMNAKLLQKIEELTLYMIEMKKENEIIKKENTEMKKDILLLKKTK